MVGGAEAGPQVWWKDTRALAFERSNLSQWFSVLAAKRTV